MSVYKNDKLTHFKQAVDSLLNQTLAPSEIIITVDGFVSKEISEYLDELSKDRLFVINRLLVNKGLANALNQGVNNSKYDIIARMDADDICHEDRFKIQLTAMMSNNYDIVGGQVVGFGKDVSDVILRRTLPLNQNEIGKLIKSRNPIAHPTALFKREVFDKLDGYDVNIFQEDYDFFVRAYMNGFKMSNVKDEVLWFRMGEDNNSIRRRHGLGIIKKEFRLYKKFLKIGFFSKKDFVLNIIIKGLLRLLPLFIFKHLYLWMNKN